MVASEWERAAQPARGPRRPAGQLLTVNQVAALLAVSRTTVYRLCAQGCPVLRVGYHLRFEQAAVMRWIRTQGVSE